MKTKKKIKVSMVNPNAAGVDIGSSFHFVAVPADRSETPVRRFGSFTRDLHELAKWLQQCNIKTVAMESTGVYWLQLFLILEEYGFEVFLVNAQHIKNVSGRKTDVLDCQWIQQLHSYGLLSASFQPEDMIRTLRGYMRHRKNLTQDYSTQVLRMQKAFEQLNVKLHNVITDITGKSGQLIIRAILAGERDAETLASLASDRVKAKKEDIILSLEGNWKEGPLFELRQSYELYLIYKQKIAECDNQIKEHMEILVSKENTEIGQDSARKVYSKNRLNFNATPYLKGIAGVDLTEVFGISEVCAMEIVSETGLDMSKWPSVKHFISWLNLSPNNRISGGKLLSNKRKKSKNKAGQAFRMAAFALQRSEHYLGSFYRRMKAKGGPMYATKATARKLAVIFYYMISNQTEFTPIPIEEYDKKFMDKRMAYLKRQATKLGMELVEAEP
ncbi:IS110 family transposase [Cyclobacterium sp.]|uniref:IS110 family transposase n=1 Tax=Cyclobacterium sp. TaxID=1966343 RepID=UPI001998E065|nr:IS110 family transposase [Cyclobacterium sp.]MBD3626483.1 IS110 family transposase [Cyclobacterium sp.]